MKNRELYFETWSKRRLTWEIMQVVVFLYSSAWLPNLFPLQLKELMIPSPISATLPQKET